MIRLIEVTKKYKALHAVDRLSLEVGEGTIFGFLGPNGAGKTTTVKMMAGILQPTSGRIIIGGIDLSRDPTAAKSRIGFIPDRPFLYEKLTATEFLRFVAGLYGMDRRVSTLSRVEELLGLFDLLSWADELIEGYSHGMKQRLIMSAALLHEPKVLIVDEPMVGLDPQGARLVKDIMKDEARKGTTIFMSTHSLDVAQEVCSHIGIIRQGKLIAQGSAGELARMANMEGSLESVYLKLTGGKQSIHG